MWQALPIADYRENAMGRLRRIGARAWKRLWRPLAVVRMRIPSGRKLHQHRYPPVIVSLTSYPPRIAHVWYTVESILRQNALPDRIIIVLSTDEFPDHTLPARLEAQRQRGLEVMWVDGNTRSYKKLLPVLDAYPEAVIVTIDDDVVYQSSFLGDLLEAHQATPRDVLGHRGWEVQLDLPYRQWIRATTSTPRHRTLLTGVGGILYPPGALAGTVADTDAAMNLCPTNDDLWFWACAVSKGTRIRRIADGRREPYNRIEHHPSSSLWEINVVGGQNDVQLSRVVDHFGIAPPPNATTAD